jgi:hypothetical protein
MIRRSGSGRGKESLHWSQTVSFLSHLPVF